MVGQLKNRTSRSIAQRKQRTTPESAACAARIIISVCQRVRSSKIYHVGDLCYTGIPCGLINVAPKSTGFCATPPTKWPGILNPEPQIPNQVYLRQNPDKMRMDYALSREVTPKRCILSFTP